MITRWQSIARRRAGLGKSWPLGAALLLGGAAWLYVIPLAAQQPAGEADADAAPVGATEASADSASPDTSRSEDDPAVAAALRMREGTQLTDHLGFFRQNGDSLTFVDKDGRELGGLPNLGLERIIRMLKSVEEPESVTWSVSGMVTEFAGRNYLLVSRAVYKAAAQPPTPDAL